MRRIVTWIISIALLMAAWGIGTQIYSALSFPTHLRLLPGQEFILDLGPFLRAKTDNPDWVTDLGRDGVAVRAPDTEQAAEDLQLSLLGIPLRRAQVDVVPRLELVPSGHAIGVLMGHGVLVTQVTSVVGPGGRIAYPARDAGLQPGDVIVEAAGQTISHGAQLESLTQEYGSLGKPMPIVVERGGQRLRLNVMPHPVANGDSERYMLGIWVRDSAAGVGTLTFWDPATGRYGALGHRIADGPSGETGGMTIGQIVSASIHGVTPGSRGRPGEKRGFFEEGKGTLGSIDTNTNFGIFGQLEVPPDTTQKPLPVALAHEVKPGPATILTVVDGQRVESFEIEILQVRRQSSPDDKGLIIRVTDPRLLAKTNGIVQGMSGSPIIQDGMIVGAVTHVFVNDPHRGYGILAEWMAYEAGLLVHGNQAGSDELRQTG